MKIAMIGGSSKEPSGLLDLDRSWEFWGLNNCIPKWLGHRYVRFDKWFHLHQRSSLAEQIPEHLKWFEEWAAKHTEIEFVLLEPYEGIPNAMVFPRSALALMPRGGYHCSSFDWMVAYAIFLGAKEIFITGVQLHTQQSSEPISSGSCLEYWIGYAEGRGIKVTTADDCDLFYNYRLVRDHRAYGYDEFDIVEDVT